ncbi:hypothetical protein DFP72DRAFT_991158 [Ephemerocybe angulata]|uniref:Uncharacterized protein n=1 Tax=Ephemerocybe angulata TaxID=980116 RepID=A0A8H6HSQ2_9AGAR|nr:hypothetical protein DFP72DRAFT_991158 [Tulosesus angulatus]
MPEFEITAAQIVGLFMESVFYVTFFSCMRVLLWRDGRLKAWSEMKKMMVIAALLMLVFGSLDVAFGLRHNLEAFVYQLAKGVQPAEEFGKISKWLNVMKFANYTAQTFIGDGILLYRCYVIYNRRWWVAILPALMWLATAACSGVTIYIESTIGNGDLSESQFEPFISSTLALTLATNLITTSLIVWRIYKIQSRTSSHTLSQITGSTDSPYSRLILLFGCYLANSNAILGVSNSGITFNLLILNIDRGTTTQATSASYHSNAGFINSTQRGVALHELRIKTVTTTTRDPPDGFHVSSQVKSATTRANDDLSFDDSVDIEKAVTSTSPPSPAFARGMEGKPRAL